VDEKTPSLLHYAITESYDILNGKRWKKIGLEPDKPEDIIDLEVLLNSPKPKLSEKKVGRNELCPCGNGKKCKKCCGI